MLPPLTAADTLLFVGDSITDSDRLNDPARLGKGFVRQVQQWLVSRDPADAPSVVNRGVSGNTIRHVSERWDADVLAVAPTVVSLMIGVNDVWRQFDKLDEPVSPGDYEAIMDFRLAELRDKLPEVTVVLATPTPIDPPQDPAANEAMAEYLDVVARMAERHAVGPPVPTNAAVRAAADARPDLGWTTDGVHPTELGVTLLARTWLAACGQL